MTAKCDCPESACYDFGTPGCSHLEMKKHIQPRRILVLGDETGEVTRAMAKIPRVEIITPDTLMVNNRDDIKIN